MKARGDGSSWRVSEVRFLKPEGSTPDGIGSKLSSAGLVELVDTRVSEARDSFGS